MTTPTTERTRLHDLAWTRSAKGYSIFTRWRGMHLSIYSRPNEETYRFRIDGAFPVAVTSTHEAVGFLWRRLLSRFGVEVSL
jgi:hypothetical protein